MYIEKYTKKNGTTAYRFRVYVGKQNGKDKYVKRSGFKTKGEARNTLLNLLEQIEDEKVNKPITFGQAASKWLDEYYETVRESTYIKTKELLDNHILPALKNKQLKDITPLMLQEQMNLWMKQLVKARTFKGIISRIFKYGIRHGYIDSDPTSSLELPQKKQRQTNKKDFYTKPELRTLLALFEAKGNIEKLCMFRLLAFTGIRKGELLALTWEDWKGNTLTINKAITNTLTGFEIGQTKTKSSNRLISLDAKTIQILQDYKDTTDGTGLIFQSETGGILSVAKPRKWLLNTIKNSELEPIKIHGFRHTHASLCFESGMTLKQVQYRLGHSDLQTTMNVYTHITSEAKDDIGEKFSQYIDF